MILEGILLFVTKTITIYPGDYVRNCDIGGAKGLDAVISIPIETVESKDYEVSGNTIEIGAEKSKFQFIYVG